MGKVKCPTGNLIADHIYMRLQHHGRRILITRCGWLLDQKIMVGILLGFQSQPLRPMVQIITQGLFLSADMRDLAQCIKMTKYPQFKQLFFCQSRGF